MGTRGASRSLKSLTTPVGRKVDHKPADVRVPVTDPVANPGRGVLWEERPRPSPVAGAFASGRPSSRRCAMTALLIGYARCSTDQQDLTAQRDGLVALGVAGNQDLRRPRVTGT